MLVQTLSASPGRVCDLDLLLGFELMLDADVEVAGAVRYVMVHAAAGRQANIQPFQEVGLLDVAGGDSEPSTHVGKILRLRRHDFQKPRCSPHSPLDKADIGRIHSLETQTFVA